MKTLEEVLAANLKALREQKGMSQKDLAKAAGLTVQAVNRYENGKQFPRKAYAEALSKALGCTQKEELFIGLGLSTAVPHDVLAALAAVDDGRLDDIRLLLRLPTPERAPRAAKKKL